MQGLESSKASVRLGLPDGAVQGLLRGIRAPAVSKLVQNGDSALNVTHFV